jgi:hypothetical protein
MTKTKSKKKAKKTESSGARQQEFPDTPWGHKQRERLNNTGPDAKTTETSTE